MKQHRVGFLASRGGWKVMGRGTTHVLNVFLQANELWYEKLTKIFLPTVGLVLVCCLGKFVLFFILFFLKSHSLLSSRSFTPQPFTIPPNTSTSKFCPTSSPSGFHHQEVHVCLSLFSHSVVSESLQPHGLQHTRPPCPSLSPGVCSSSSSLSW